MGLVVDATPRLPQRRGNPPPVDGGRGGGDDGGMELRLTHIESRLDSIDTRLVKIETLMPTFATKADLAEGINKQIQWLVGTAIAISAAAVTIMTFVLNNAIPKAAPPQPQPPAIIINVPSPTAPVAPVAPPAKP